MNVYKCEVECTAAGIAVQLNDYLIYSSTAGGHSFSTDIPPWMEARNQFRVRVFPSDLATPGDAVRFTVRSLWTDSAGVLTTLSQMSFPAGVSAAAPPAFPFDTAGSKLAPGNSLEFDCPVPADVLVKPWNQTTVRITDPAPVYQLYGRIQNALVSGDVPALMELSRDRTTFLAQVYRMPRAQLEAEMRRDWTSEIAAGTRWRTYSDPRRELTVHEYLPGKIVRVLDLDRMPPLRSIAGADGVQSGYDVIIASTPNGICWIM